MNESKRPDNIDKRWDSFWTIVDEKDNPILFFNETGAYDGNGKKLADGKKLVPNDDEPPKGD